MKFYLIQSKDDYREKAFIQEWEDGAETLLLTFNFGPHPALTEAVTDELTNKFTADIVDALIIQRLHEKNNEQSRMAEARDTTKIILKKLFSSESS